MNKSQPAQKTKSEETRTNILNSALELFRQQGFEHTTMRQVAAKAGMALGAAYYYFPSKDALVMAFYERAQVEMEPLLAKALAREKGLEGRLRALLEVKFAYFRPDRRLLGALSAHTDPHHPLSPFSKQTKGIRDKDLAFFVQALAGSSVKVPRDLAPYLPRVLWLYQMGLLLFWVYDDSPQQSRTQRLLELSLSIVARLIKFSPLPFLGPVRKRVVELLLAVSGGEGPQAGAGRE